MYTDNYHKVHSFLGYQTPIQYRQNNLKKISKKVLTIQILFYFTLEQTNIMVIIFRLYSIKNLLFHYLRPINL